MFSNKILTSKRNVFIPFVIFIVTYLCFASRVYNFLRFRVLTTNDDWDLLIFTQLWPNSACLEWEEEDTNNTCDMPKHKGHWNIHGIWPTKLGTLGPSFCNASVPFNITALDDIMDDLNEYWTDIHLPHKKKNMFWKHEWNKHGRCAVSLEKINTESKYFHQALSWYKDYNMIEILNFNKIVPKELSVGYQVEDISNSVKNSIGKVPFIHCVIDKKSKLPFLSEVRICFDKSFTLVDCYGVKMDRSDRPLYFTSSLTNCPPGRPIVYPKNVPPTTRSPSKPDDDLVVFYKVVSLLKWFTT